MKKLIQEKERAIHLRLKGFSYNEIAKKIGVSKSILSLWLRNVVISDNAKNRIRQREDANRDRFSKMSSSGKLKKLNYVRIAAAKEFWNNLSPEEKVERIDALKWEQVKSNLNYLKHEIPIKKALEKIFNKEFCKEQIRGYFIDFYGSGFAIEHTNDYGKGITIAMKRLSACPKILNKIIICPSYGFGPNRKKICPSAIHWPIKDFEKLIVPTEIKNIIG